MKKVLESVNTQELVEVSEFLETYSLAAKPEYTGKLKDLYVEELAKDYKECFQDSSCELDSGKCVQLAFFRLKKAAELYQLNKMYNDKKALSEIQKKAKQLRHEFEFFQALAS